MAIFIFIKRLWQCQVSKCTDLQVKFPKFSGSYAPRPSYRGGATAPLPRSHRSALRVYRASLGAFSISQPPNQTSWIHPWAHPPLKILAMPMVTIFWQSVKIGYCRGPKFAISHWLSRSPLTQCWARDQHHMVVHSLSVGRASCTVLITQF